MCDGWCVLEWFQCGRNECLAKQTCWEWSGKLLMLCYAWFSNVVVILNELSWVFDSVERACVIKGAISNDEHEKRLFFLMNLWKLLEALKFFLKRESYSMQSVQAKCSERSFACSNTTDRITLTSHTRTKFFTTLFEFDTGHFSDAETSREFGFCFMGPTTPTFKMNVNVRDR